MIDAAASPCDHGLSYSEWALGQTHHALVVTPSEDIDWGPAMLEALRVDIGSSARDVEIVDVFRSARSRPRVFVFRGANRDGSARIRLDSALDDEEREELGYLLFRSHLPLLRCLLASGAQLYVYVDWEPDVLDLFRRVMGRIAQERGQGMAADADLSTQGLVKLDRWILTRLTLFCAQPFDDVISGLLPDSLPLFDRRQERVTRLLDGIAPESFVLHAEAPCE